jgi:hypothetical protein
MTILLSADLYRKLAGLARAQNRSISELVCEAVEVKYGAGARPDSRPIPPVRRTGRAVKRETPRLPRSLGPLFDPSLAVKKPEAI